MATVHRMESIRHVETWHSITQTQQQRLREEHARLQRVVQTHVRQNIIIHDNAHQRATHRNTIRTQILRMRAVAQYLTPIDQIQVSQAEVTQATEAHQ